MRAGNCQLFTFLRIKNLITRLYLRSFRFFNSITVRDNYSSLSFFIVDFSRSVIHHIFMIISTSKDLGSLIKEKRKMLGLSQKEAAAIIGVGVRFLSELENGKPTLEIDKALSVAKFFGIDLEAQSR